MKSNFLKCETYILQTIYLLSEILNWIDQIMEFADTNRHYHQKSFTKLQRQDFKMFQKYSVSFWNITLAYYTCNLNIRPHYLWAIWIYPNDMLLKIYYNVINILHDIEIIVVFHSCFALRFSKIDKEKTNQSFLSKL